MVCVLNGALIVSEQVPVKVGALFIDPTALNVSVIDCKLGNNPTIFIVLVTAVLVELILINPVSIATDMKSDTAKGQPSV